MKAWNKKVLKFVSSCLTELPAHFSFPRMKVVNKLREAIFDSDDEFSWCCWKINNIFVTQGLLFRGDYLNIRYYIHKLDATQSEGSKG